MKKIGFVFAVALLAAVTASCSDGFPLQIIRGNGTPVDRVIDARGFNAIKIAGSIDVYFTQGPESVTLTADENLADFYEIEVEAGTLRAAERRGCFIFPKATTFLTVSAPDLNRINISGSGDCYINGGFQTEGDFVIHISGSGDIDANRIECRNFSAEITGSGDIEIEKTNCDNALLTITGSGDMDVESITASALALIISGSGDAEIGCQEVGDITVRISGSGDVRLCGTASSLDSDISGSGKVDRKDLVLQ